MLTCKWTVFVCKKVCTVNSFMHVVCKIYAWNRLYKLSWIALLDCCHLCRTVVNVGIMWGPWIASELLSSKHRWFLMPGTSQSPVQSSGTVCTDRSPSFITKCCWVYQTVKNFLVFSPGLSHLRTIHTCTHPFNCLLSGPTQVSQYQKGKTNLDFTEERDSEWQWRQLDHMQVCI